MVVTTTPPVGSETRDESATRAAKMLIAGQLGQLDAELRTALEQKQRLTGGYSKFFCMIGGLMSPGKTPNENDWKQHFRRLDGWKESSPNSLNPRLALAGSWIAYAYVARGDGYANTVSDSNWRLFMERVEFARSELTLARSIGGDSCPEWYRLMIQVTEFMQGDTDTEYSYFEQGFQLDPTYYQLSATLANYLQPKWHGKPGDMAKFISTASDRVDGDEGKILYFELVSTMQSQLRSDIFSSGLSWERAREGYQLLKEHYGTDRYRRNMFFYLACFSREGSSAGALPTMVTAADEVGNDWDSEVWSTRKLFDDMRSGVEMIRKTSVEIGSAKQLTH